MSDKVIRLAQLSRFLQDLKATVDSALSLNSENPVQNKVVTEALNSKVPDTRKVAGLPLSADIPVDALRNILSIDNSTLPYEPITNSQIDELFV